MQHDCACRWGSTSVQREDRMGLGGPQRFREGERIGSGPHISGAHNTHHWERLLLLTALFDIPSQPLADLRPLLHGCGLKCIRGNQRPDTVPPSPASGASRARTPDLRHRRMIYPGDPRAAQTRRPCSVAHENGNLRAKSVLAFGASKSQT